MGNAPTARLRGRAGVEQRKRRLARTNYLCEMCLAQGITRLADVVDHRTPLAMGGDDSDGNTQNLCNDCHDSKTAYESASSEAVAFHPAWLKRSAVPLQIVCGPPCSGKSTYIRERASPNDIVIDLDTIMMRIDPRYKHWAGRLSTHLLHQGTRVRNALLGSLERRASGRAWFIVSAPTEAERAWWLSKLGGEVVLLHPGEQECKRRAKVRGTPEAISGIDRWERNAKMPWAPKESAPRKAVIGLDGWPVEGRSAT